MDASLPALVAFPLLHAWQDRFPPLGDAPLRLVVTVPALDALGAAVTVRVHPDAELALYVHEGLRLCVGRDALVDILQAYAPSHVQSSAVTLGSKRLASRTLGDARRVLGFVAGEELRGLRCLHPLTGAPVDVTIDDAVELATSGAVCDVGEAPPSETIDAVRAQLLAVGAWLAGP